MTKKIQDNIQKIQDDIHTIHQKTGQNHLVTLICATKYCSIKQIQDLIGIGQTHFGENKIQDSIQKISTLDIPSISWHFIGHLQRNKVKQALKLYTCIQSVDSLRLLEKINHESERITKVQDVFIQLHLNNEPSQFGFKTNEFEQHLDEIFSFPYCKIRGIMTIGTHSNNQDDTRQVFKKAKMIFDQVKSSYPDLKELSMGMSNDYHIAVEEGATMIRIGQLIFK